MEDKLNVFLKEKVFEGKLPLALVNSFIIRSVNKPLGVNNSKIKIINNKYKQYDFPEPISNILISKIYDFH